MKETTLVKLLVGAACMVALGVAVAQESSTTTTTTNPATGVTTASTTTSSGTITAYTPGSDYISFRTTTDAAPVKYYGKDTTILDAEGRVSSWSAIRPDLPATVYYVREGDRMLVRKIILSKPTTIEKETTTTTTRP
jgi:hypothetical protein